MWLQKNLPMRQHRLLLTLAFVACSTVTPAQKIADPILLWPNGAPRATGTSDEDKPAIIPFIPDPAKRNGAAILVVPGGGFTIRAIDHEGVLVAQWLRDHGITAFVLRYRLRPMYTRNEWVSDGQRAMQYIRAHAAEYKLSPDRLGAIGFSAGANLIADMTLNPLMGKPDADDPLDRLSSKPDFMILGYGAMRIPASTDSTVIAALPPTFMYGTVEDRGSQTGMLEMYSRLYRAGAPVEAHFFQNGIHGTGFALGDPVLGEWTKLLNHWLVAGGFLTDKPRVSLSGVVKLNGSPLVKGMVIFSPVENNNAPPVVVYINNTGIGEMGRFVVPVSQGPVKGKYKVEVRQDANRWTSNSREPFMIKMMEKQRTNMLSEADIKEWSEYIRKRDLSPSINNQVVYARQHPGDKNDYVIEVGADDILIEVFNK
jgi:acetyl esterase/lipase